ncbi:MAG: hypothetical protein HN353_05625 [Bdellovibrionales bacterium]|jgi:hypothetical protein|nr:hypothetical protein [Bdellovibrionales bacterium]MBT3525078.1 hypothetical protein [Bdellovibrionales bacterium]MBT7669782.1 hypothetical protein [Bdellovibrionales bacterium]MBT7767401.1 hypothetical protein [Bdellovibrionales bacterium]
MDTIDCRFCSGAMEAVAVHKFNRHFGVVFIILGALFAISMVGLLLGVILLALGVYIVTSKKSVWVCKSCRTTLERIEDRGGSTS